jgi:hypothetical protein
LRGKLKTEPPGLGFYKLWGMVGLGSGDPFSVGYTGVEELGGRNQPAHESGGI